MGLAAVASHSRLDPVGSSAYTDVTGSEGGAAAAKDNRGFHDCLCACIKETKKIPFPDKTIYRRNIYCLFNYRNEYIKMLFYL